MKLLKVTVMATALTLLSSAGCNNEQKTDGIAQSPNTTNVEKQEFTPEVLNQFKRVAGVQVSPDGKKILYSVNTIDIEKNKGNNDLWVMDVDGQNAKQITSTPNSEGNAVWFDNGKKIAFTYCDDSKEDAVTQVWVMDADGGNRKWQNWKTVKT